MKYITFIRIFYVEWGIDKLLSLRTLLVFDRGTNDLRDNLREESLKSFDSSQSVASRTSKLAQRWLYFRGAIKLYSSLDSSSSSFVAWGLCKYLTAILRLFLSWLVRETPLWFSRDILQYCKAWWKEAPLAGFGSSRCTPTRPVTPPLRHAIGRQ